MEKMRKHFVWFFTSILVLIGLAACCPPFCINSPDPDESSIVEIIKLDFEPINSSNYNLTCTNDHMIYSQGAKLFRPIIRLNRPAPVGFEFNVTIQEDGVFSDPTIGFFTVRFETGDTVPSSINTPNDKETVELALGMNINRMPVGAPVQETRGFWLGCTKKCKIRGNGPAGDPGRQNVYLDRDNIFRPDGPMELGGKDKSPNHQVECL